jgi:hypothetical protein
MHASTVANDTTAAITAFLLILNSNTTYASNHRTADRQEYVSPVLVQQLRDTGVSTADAVAALKYANNDPAAAVAYLTGTTRYY